jgi:hypothetical protein
MFGLARTHPGEISLTALPGLPSDAQEVARIWVTSDRSFVAVGRSAAWEPELLGSLIVECVYNAAATYASGGAISQPEALDRLWRGFDEERARLRSQESPEEHQ